MRSRRERESSSGIEQVGHALALAGDLEVSGEVEHARAAHCGVGGSQPQRVLGQDDGLLGRSRGRMRRRPRPRPSPQARRRGAASRAPGGARAAPRPPRDVRQLQMQRAPVRAPASRISPRPPGADARDAGGRRRATTTPASTASSSTAWSAIAASLDTRRSGSSASASISLRTGASSCATRAPEQVLDGLRQRHVVGQRRRPAAGDRPADLEREERVAERRLVARGAGRGAAARARAARTASGASRRSESVRPRCWPGASPSARSSVR